MILDKLELYKYKETIIIIVTIIQFAIYTLHPLLGKKIDEKIDIPVSTKIFTSFTEINNELRSIENLNIIELENLEDNWSIKVSINGEKEVITKSIEKLETFKIRDYSIEGNKDNLSVILKLHR